jgi:hypothetical protein
MIDAAMVARIVRDSVETGDVYVGESDEPLDFVAVIEPENPSDVIIHIWAGPRFRISVVREG